MSEPTQAAVSIEAAIDAALGVLTLCQTLRTLSQNGANDAMPGALAAAARQSAALAAQLTLIEEALQS